MLSDVTSAIHDDLKLETGVAEWMAEEIAINLPFKAEDRK